MSNQKVEELIIEARVDLAKALNEIRGESEEVVIEPIEQKPSLSSSIVVGFAEGNPGETVRVQVLGGTHVPVRGMSVAIGVDRRLGYVGGTESEEFKQILNLSDVEDIIRLQNRGQHPTDRWLQLMLGFYGQVWGVFEAEMEEGETPNLQGKRTLIDVMIPPMTPLYLLDFKIPDDAVPGDKYELDIEKRYGHKLNSNGPIKFIEWPPMYATSRHVAKHGVTRDQVEQVSGWVLVKEPE